MLVTMKYEATATTNALICRRAQPAPSSRLRVSSRANFMCRDSSTTWMLLMVRTNGTTRSSRIQSRCITSSTSSATRIAAYAASPNASVLNARPSSITARRGR
ncbi:hypothetical protein SCALM49S_01829 [Streptomyces californicus]